MVRFEVSWHFLEPSPFCLAIFWSQTTLPRLRCCWCRCWAVSLPHAIFLPCFDHTHRIKHSSGFQRCGGGGGGSRSSPCRRFRSCCRWAVMILFAPRIRHQSCYMQDLSSLKEIVGSFKPPDISMSHLTALDSYVILREP